MTIEITTDNFGLFIICPLLVTFWLGMLFQCYLEKRRMK